LTAPPDEDALLRAAAAGDRAALEAFVEAAAPAAWALLRRLTADAATAEDALQETFVAAWQAAPQWRGDGPARAWLLGIARRQAARTWRRRAGEPPTTDELGALAVAAGWGADPEALAARAEDRARLLAALASLSPADREAITRVDLEGLRPAELAAARRRGPRRPPPRPPARPPAGGRVSPGVALLLLALLGVGALLLAQALAARAARAREGQPVGPLPAAWAHLAGADALLWFHSPRCGPCRAMRPAAEALAAAGRLVPVDVTADLALAQALGVRATPTTVRLRAGMVVAVRLGALRAAELEALAG